MKVLAIETSCDETAAAIVESGDRPIVVTNVIYSQIKEHALNGGVIPEKAARLHNITLNKVIDQATRHRSINYDAIAVTVGPGLIGSLLMGATAAKTLAYLEHKPIYPINHLEGHIYSSFLGDKPPQLPALVLIISGGHSTSVIMNRRYQFETVGITRDDAAGEAFDKIAKLLGLPYPGGPELSKLAEKGDKETYQLPIALKDEDTGDFSFSGLKAATAQIIRRQKMNQQQKANLAASFEHTVAKTIATKTEWALDKLPEIKSLVLVGGVSANRYLRNYLADMIAKEYPKILFSVPPLEYCTDNAAMIGVAATFKAETNRPTPIHQVICDPNLKL